MLSGAPFRNADEGQSHDLCHSCIQFNSSSAMFSYPSCPILPTRDLVLDDHGSSPTMHSGASVRTREDEKISLAAWESVVAGHIQRLEFLRFDGTSDPLWWIHRCECYFRAHRSLENKRVMYAAFHLLDDAQLWYHRLPNNGGPSTWEQFVLLIAARFGSQFTGKPLSTPTLGGDAAAREGMNDNNVLFKVVGKGDDALHADDGSSERGVGNDGILVVGEGDDALPTDDDSGALRADGGSDTTVLVIGAIGVGSSLGVICRVIGGGGANLDVGTLCMGGGNIILSLGDLSTGVRCLSGGSGALATRKGGGILHAGGGILGTHSCGGPDHVVIHDLPESDAFTTAAPPLCAHKESCWSFMLHPGRCSTSNLTHHQRYKMLLSLSESGWGPPVSGWGQSEQEE
jgi:hypothetical protein